MTCATCGRALDLPAYLDGARITVRCRQCCDSNPNPDADLIADIRAQLEQKARQAYQPRRAANAPRIAKDAPDGPEACLEAPLERIA